MSKSDLFDRIARLDHPDVGHLVTPPPELIGFFVYFVRKLHQWKQNTLAEFASLSVSTIERIERGEKVSNEALENVAEALGYERDYFKAPRYRKSLEQAVADLAEQWQEIEPVSVSPLRTQRQVRVLAKTQALLIHRPGLGDAYNEQVAELTEWLDLASGFFSVPDPMEKGRRRELYNDILACVLRLEERRVTVLAGIMDAPQDGLPDWKVGVISLTPKLSDPGASKRRVVLVDRRSVALQLPLRSSFDGH
jgi:transcriptional regulator with XRE-family HTH domain